MLSFRHLMIFREVCETENFTRAAQKLYITQSAVSHAIKELEEYTGTVLFDRLSKQVRLTAGGKLLLDEVLPILTACESLDRRMGRLETHAPIRLVSCITIAAFRLPQILSAFERRMPEHPVSVKVVPAAEAIRTLQAGDADLAFLEGARPQGPFLSAPFGTYTMQIVCAPGYPLPACRLSLREFCSQKLLLREPGSAIRDTLDSQLLLAGYTARPLWVSVNSTALLEAAKASLGITVLPEALVTDELSKKRLRALCVDGLSLSNDMLTVRHKDKRLTPALRMLLSLCAPSAADSCR